MSLLVVVATRAGIAISGDSCGAIMPTRPADAGPLVPFNESSDKVCTIAGRFGFGVVGMAPPEGWPEVLSRNDAVMTATDPAPLLAALSNAAPPDGKTLMVLNYYDPSGLPVVSALECQKRVRQRVNVDPQGRPCAGIYPFGDPEDVDAAIRSAGGTGNVDIPVSELSAQQCADLSRFLVAFAIGLNQFRGRPRLIGGAITTALITRTEGARMLTLPQIVVRDFGLARRGDAQAAA